MSILGPVLALYFRLFNCLIIRFECIKYKYRLSVKVKYNTDIVTVQTVTVIVLEFTNTFATTNSIFP